MPKSGDSPISLEARDEVFGIFHDVVKTSADTRAVEKWVASETVHANLFDDFVLGQIRWPRSLGRPDAATLSEGFVIQMKFWVDIWHIGIDGSVVIDLEGWTPGLAPDVRDGPPETDHYSVRYMFHAPANKDSQVEIQFSDVRWTHPGRATIDRRLYLSSHGFQLYSDGKFMALPDITVANQPFFHT